MKIAKYFALSPLLSFSPLPYFWKSCKDTPDPRKGALCPKSGSPARTLLIPARGLYAIFLCMVIPSMMQAQVNWLYRYGTQYEDHAGSLACGPDNTIYVAGTAFGPNPSEWVVLSLSSGDTNWIYRLDTPPGCNNWALDICYGNDSNIYVGGWSNGFVFTIASLSQSGAVNWIYYDPNAQEAHALAFADSTLYAAGTTSGQLVIESLRSDGDTNWVRYPDAGEAWAIAVGDSNTVYAAGYGTDYRAVVVSMDASGDTNWVRYHYRQPSWFCDLKYGLDGNIYAAGYYYEYMETTNFIVMSLTSNGDTNWTYEFDGNNNYPYDWDDAYSIACGTDSNIYVAGTSEGNGLLIVSLDRWGNERWIHGYPGAMMGPSWNTSKEITYGADNHLYVTGHNGDGRFLVLKMDTLGNIDWAYTYQDSLFPAGFANGIVYGYDSNVYAAGRIETSNHDMDILVVSIGPEGKIDENASAKVVMPNVKNYPTIFRGSLPNLSGLKNYKVYDIMGRHVNPSSPAPGIYFIEIDGKIEQKVIKVR